jgi:hypothetical protein
MIFLGKVRKKDGAPCRTNITNMFRRLHYSSANMKHHESELTDEIVSWDPMVDNVPLAAGCNPRVDRPKSAFYFGRWPSTDSDPDHVVHERRIEHMLLLKTAVPLGWSCISSGHAGVWVKSDGPT